MRKKKTNSVIKVLRMLSNEGPLWDHELSSDHLPMMARDGLISGYQHMTDSSVLYKITYKGYSVLDHGDRSMWSKFWSWISP